MSDQVAETAAIERLDVELGARSYPIWIGADILQSSAIFDATVESRDVLIVTNDRVAPLYVAPLKRALGERRVELVELPDGEQHKTLRSVERIIDALAASRMNRDCALVALGGGVVGDIAGFAAACYQRGVDYVQVPTTLLAQVDSSVGGKTGVNHAAGKNLIGAFHQPRGVVADTRTLTTLSAREYAAGLAEVVKYGLIQDSQFFAWQERSVDELNARDPGTLQAAIRRCCEIKARIVSEDEREGGVRALLNLGHTFGHAIETAVGYGEWLHGEAVAAGIVLAADMSHRLGSLAAADLARIRQLLSSFGLPVAAPRIGAGRALELMGMDKKVVRGQVRLVLLERIGSAVLRADFPQSELCATLEQGFA